MYASSFLCCSAAPSSPGAHHVMKPPLLVSSNLTAIGFYIPIVKPFLRWYIASILTILPSVTTMIGL